MVNIADYNKTEESYVSSTLRKNLDNKFRENYSKLFLDFIKDIKHKSATKEQREALILEYQKKMESDYTQIFRPLVNYINKYSKYSFSRYKEDDKPTDTEMKETLDRLVRYFDNIDNEEVFRKQIRDMDYKELYRMGFDLQVIFNKTLKHNQEYLNALMIKTLEKAVSNKEKFERENFDNYDLGRRSA